MSFVDFKRQLQAQLQSFGVASPEAECRLLAEEIFQRPWFDLLTTTVFEPKTAELQALEAAVQRRARREPLQHILGHAYFRELDLQVSPAVLIPRPETEILVDLVLEKIPQHGTLLDLGTGSGAIALSAAYERSDLAVCAVDVSPDALAVARTNAQKYQLDRVEFHLSNLFSALAKRQFHAIAANLPYVTETEYLSLEPELRFDPKLALTAPDDGFALIEATARELRNHLLPGGFAVFELSPFQAPRLVELLATLGLQGTIRRDLTGRDRFVVAE